MVQYYSIVHTEYVPLRTKHMQPGMIPDVMQVTVQISMYPGWCILAHKFKCNCDTHYWKVVHSHNSLWIDIRQYQSQPCCTDKSLLSTCFLVIQRAKCALLQSRLRKLGFLYLLSLQGRLAPCTLHSSKQFAIGFGSSKHLTQTKCVYPWLCISSWPATG